MAEGDNSVNHTKVNFEEIKGDCERGTATTNDGSIASHLTPLIPDQFWVLFDNRGVRVECVAAVDSENDAWYVAWVRMISKQNPVILEDHGVMGCIAWLKAQGWSMKSAHLVADKLNGVK